MTTETSTQIIQSLMQITSAIEEASNKLESAHSSKNIEQINQLKRYILQLKNKFSQLIQQLNSEI